MADCEKYDSKNKRKILMYVENGMQHRHNSVPLDGRIPQHIHYKNGHWTHILNGIFDLLEKLTENDPETTREVRKGDRIWVGRGVQHTFIPKDVPTGWLQRWSVDCVYPEGVIL